MSSPLPFRRPLQHLGLAGVGSAVLLVGIASPAVAATGVVIPLAPEQVALGTVPLENFSAPMDPMDLNAGVFTPVPVQYSGTITVDLPAGLDGSTAINAELAFDDDGDGTPEATYSSQVAPTDPNYLVVAPTAGSVTVTLPADDPIAGDVADLTLEPVTTTLGPGFTFIDPVFYTLGFDSAAPAAQTVAPTLAAASQIPCDLTSGARCPFPTPVTVGSAVTLDLTADSRLRAVGLTDLTGVLVGLQQLDADGLPTGAAPVELTAVVTGSTASVLIPAGTAVGSHLLVVAQETPSGGVSVVQVEIAVVAEAAPVVPPAAAPTTPAATVVNAGLRSNTGVEAVEPGSTGTVAIAAGAGVLVLAGAGGVAVARSRRRPAAEGGTCA